MPESRVEQTHGVLAAQGLRRQSRSLLLQLKSSDATLFGRKRIPVFVPSGFRSGDEHRGALGSQVLAYT
jgi:hypothetical protein